MTRGVPLEQISKRLRHSNIAVTHDLYLHLSAELDREVADTAAAALRR